MHKTSSLAVLLLVASLGCGGAEDELSASSEAAFTPAQCGGIRATQPLARPGAARSTLRQCIFSSRGGPFLMQRAVAMSADTARFRTMRNAEGAPLFTRFSPRRANGEIQEVDVALNVDYRPSARLRITRRFLEDGRYFVHITNVTPFSALFTEAIPVDGFRLELVIQADATGVLVTGSSQVTILVEDAFEHAPGASQAVFGLFDLLRSEIAAPP
jgi:hypothetical protein